MKGPEKTPPRAGRRGRHVLAGALVLVLAILLGPRERLQERWIEPELPERLDDFDGFLAAEEADVSDLRPGEGRGVVWVDPHLRERTAVALVYLHGFSADRHEIEPLVSDLAGRLGANAYFARLTGHGRDGSAMAEASVEDWMDDAAEAVAIGGRLGERVVLIGTSTGGTLAAWAAARPEAADRLGALVLISPNFQPKDRSSRILLWPWGGLVARLVVGRERCFATVSPAHAQHWTECYPTSALLPMMALAEHVRTADLERASAPTLVVYSMDDRVVDVEETERVVEGMGGPVELVRFEGAEGPDRHVLAGDILSPGSTDALAAVIQGFLEESGLAAAGGPEAEEGRGP